MAKDFAMKMDGVAAARSAQMSRIRSTDTTPEKRVRRFLHAAGLRYVLHLKRVPGSPDIAMPGRRLAIFVHGCFWHRHPGCKATRTPKSRTDFWLNKFRQNIERDERVRTLVSDAGWQSIIVWECETTKVSRLKDLVQQIVKTPRCESTRPTNTTTSRVKKIQ